MILFEAEILLDAHGVKKNSKRAFVNRSTGFAYVTSSNKAKVTEATMVAELGRYRSEYSWLPIREPINARFLFIYPKKEYYVSTGKRKGLRSLNLPDLSNLYELPQDALTRSGIIEDDRLILSHDGSRTMWGKERKIIIELSKFTESPEYQD